MDIFFNNKEITMEWFNIKKHEHIELYYIVTIEITENKLYRIIETVDTECEIRDYSIGVSILKQQNGKITVTERKSYESFRDEPTDKFHDFEDYEIFETTPINELESYYM